MEQAHAGGEEWGIHRDLKRWNCAQTDEIQRGQVQGPAMGWDNPKHKHRLDKEWMEVSPGERALGTLMDEKLDVTQPCELALCLGCTHCRAPMGRLVKLSMTPSFGRAFCVVAQLSLLHHEQGCLCRLEHVFNNKPLQTSFGTVCSSLLKMFKDFALF